VTPEETKQLEQDIIRGLAVPAENGVWVAVNQLLDYLKEHVELPTALRPGQSAEDRALNNGRVAMLIDFKESLHAKFHASRTPVEPGKIPKSRKG
jgi:hypothetical protein